MRDLQEGILAEFAQWLPDIAWIGERQRETGIRVRPPRERTFKAYAPPHAKECRFCHRPLPEGRMAYVVYCSPNCAVAWEKKKRIECAAASPLRSAHSIRQELKYRERLQRSLKPGSGHASERGAEGDRGE
jgi:hypothetical protein